MTYKCNECGHVFEDSEVGRYEENMGECFGVSAYQSFDCCPVCKGDFSEACVCEVCGKVCCEDELTDGVCGGCVDGYIAKNKHDILRCVSLCQENDDKEAVSINAFLRSMFDEKQIEYILLRELVSASAVSPIDCTPFLSSDKEWIAQIIKEGVKK